MRHSSRYLVALLALGACKGRNTGAADSVRSQPSVAMTPPAALAARADLVDARAQAPLRNVSRPAVFNRKLIRTAELRIQVDDVTVAVRNAGRIAGMRDAFVADLRANGTDIGSQDAQLTIRVPAPRFDEALDDLRRLGKVRNELINGEDVSKEYADLETRLGVKQETVSRLRLLLANRTGKLAEVLEVERELARTVAELEQMKGERQYYDDRVAESSINVYLFDAQKIERSTFASAIGGAVGRSVESLTASVAGLTYYTVFLTPWLALVTLGWWSSRRLWRTAHPTDPSRGESD